MSDGSVMNDPRKLTYIGAGVLVFGTFMPIVSMPMVGNLNYFASGRGDGVFLVLIAVVAAALAYLGKARHVLWAGLAAAAMLLWAFMRFQNIKSEMQEKMDTELAGNPFRGLAELAMDSVQMQWGWLPLAAGAAILVFAGLQARKTGSVPEQSPGSSIATSAGTEPANSRESATPPDAAAKAERDPGASPQ